ncbi:MAG: 4-azaleucine resistance transporter AzlC [Candidatus Krumholzibacteriia bacterium]
MNRARDFKTGMITSIPLGFSVFPFGIVGAIAARDADLSIAKTIGMSLMIFAGASQLTVVQLVKAGSPAFILLGAAVLVNLRFVMYSVALSDAVTKESRLFRAFLSYFLTDQAFGLTSAVDEKSDVNRIWFYTGSGILLWLSWQIGTVTGVVLGSVVPAWLSLDFSVALAFVALVVPHIKDWSTLVGAGASIATFLVLQDLPYGLALLPAAAVGIISGFAWESRTI